MTDRMTVQRAAPAKLNLALAVGPPRAEDGMHPIASWMVPIGLSDIVRVTRLGEGRASRYSVRWRATAMKKSPIDWPIEKDLAVRAHRALEQEVGRELAVQMDVEKRIPVGAGLGGGSSDAAAALLATCELFGVEVSTERLRALAHGLGSDVPFFLEPGAALVMGLGDEIERVPAPTLVGGEAPWFVLVVPSVSCPTGAVYRRFDEDLNAKDAKSAKRREEEIVGMARGRVIDAAALFNDLAAPAMEVAEGLREVVDRVSEAAGAPAHVTGSGSGVFVVCASRAEAEERERAVQGIGSVSVRVVGGV